MRSTHLPPTLKKERKENKVSELALKVVLVAAAEFQQQECLWEGTEGGTKNLPQGEEFCLLTVVSTSKDPVNFFVKIFSL